MSMLSLRARGRISPSLRKHTLLLLIAFAVPTAFAQTVGSNVNMVSGTQWPGGDPFLQRQNEPSMAISSRNPLHMVAGANDYRTVDLPGVGGEGEPTGDAWLGFFTSYDGGQTWTSTLVPGYPQDKSLLGQLSPVHGLQAGADPVVRAGTNGMFYFSGLAFNRSANGASDIFVASYIDDNNIEGGNSIRYLWTSVVYASNPARQQQSKNPVIYFEDKPAMAVDIPRQGAGVCVIPGPSLKTVISGAETFPAGNIYVAWTQFVGGEDSTNAQILFARSSNCGLTWSAPLTISGSTITNQGAQMAVDPNTGTVYVVWRVFQSSKDPNEIMYAASTDGGKTFSKPAAVAVINPFDQGTTNLSFRTNGYAAAAVDNTGRLYVAWAQRGVGPGGDARIEVITGLPKSGSVQWGSPVVVDPDLSQRGHQITPALAFAAGKLTVAWYDLRNDDLINLYTPLGGGHYSITLQNDGGAPDYPSFGTYIQDPAPPYASDARRQTLDVRAAQGLPANAPVFFPSVQVSEYEFGSLPGDDTIQQLQVNPPNLPMFQTGTVPFFGDYIDIAGPTFISNHNGTWRYNNQSTDPDFTHVVWTDNRDVVPPADGNWADYVPPTYGTSTTSIYDPTQTRPACSSGNTGQTGDRNQNIYTSELSPGLVIGALGNSKQLGYDPSNPSQLIQREFPITVTNTTNQTRYYQLTILAQPPGGSASFLQFPVNGLPNPLTQITVDVPALSSTSRSLFATSTTKNAAITVNAVEVTSGGTVVPNGEQGSVTINGDPSNPPVSNSNLANSENYTPTLSTPNISNPNISNPNISNPNISNPNISNTTVANPNISNPNISNPNISNPNISNPNISNPNISNPNISNAALTDGTWTVTNTGNTATAYGVNLIGQAPPAGVSLQLIISQFYTTPVAQGCTLSLESHFVPVANITNVTLATLQSLLQPAATNPTLPGLALPPGGTALITVRVFDSNTNNPAQALLDYNPITAVSPVVTSQAANTGTTTPPITLTITTKSLPQATANIAYSQELQAIGGTGSYTWSIVSGSLPAGLQLVNGSITGTPTASGTFPITVQVTDTANNVAQQPLTLVVVQPAVGISTTSLPSGNFNSLYSFTPSASGGTPPYTWSLPEGTALPAGMSFDSKSGTISGAPGQAGIWNVGIMVTDSANPATTQTVTLPLTVGLATAYAGGSNCYMPYPGTPLYYPGATSWTLTGSSLPTTAQMTVIQGDVLTGCLSGVTSGNYTLQFAVESSNFTMALPVIGQDKQDNGIYYADSGGIGNLPPSGYQQGVVTPGVSFNYNPGSYGADASNFSGSFLFGFSNGLGNVSCQSVTGNAISLTAPQPGRYDIVFNGSDQTCQQASAFPGSPAPIVIDSVDAVSTTVNYAGATVSNVSVSTTANSPIPQPQSVSDVLDIVQQSGTASIPITLTYDYATSSNYSQDGCTNDTCIIQIEFGVNTDSDPQTCGGNLSPGSSGSGATATINVPNTPGRYYVGIDRSLDYNCLYTTHNWWTGPPSAPRYIAIVDVWAPGPQ